LPRRCVRRKPSSQRRHLRWSHRRTRSLLRRCLRGKRSRHWRRLGWSHRRIVRRHPRSIHRCPTPRRSRSIRRCPTRRHSRSIRRCPIRRRPRSIHCCPLHHHHSRRSIPVVRRNCQVQTWMRRARRRQSWNASLRRRSDTPRPLPRTSDHKLQNALCSGQGRIGIGGSMLYRGVACGRSQHPSVLRPRTGGIRDQ